MSKRWLAVCALVCGLLLTPSLMAAAPQGQGKGKNKPEPSAMKDKDKGKSHDVAKDDKGKDDKDKSKGKSKAKDDDKWERKGGFETRTYGANEGNPPGWSRGKKTGWDNCGVPPGQAKQGDCRTYTYQRRRYYYYRDDQGRVVVRRPEVTIQMR